MNKATLDKATDKIIKQMTPEELAKYANNSFNLWAKGVRIGNLSHEEQCREVETFTTKHVNKLDLSDYLKYTRAILNETCTTLIKQIAEEQFKNLELRMLIIELKIESLATVFRLVESFTDDKNYSEELKAELLEESREALKPYFIRLEELKAEGKQFLEDPSWIKFGGAPVIEERVCLLSSETIKMFSIEL